MPNTILLSADYRQIEARLVAWAASYYPRTLDQPRGRLLQLFLDRQDVYRVFAGDVLNKAPEHVTDGPKGERQIIGKVGVLSQLYNISWKGLQEYVWREQRIAWDDAYARHVWETFRSSFPEVPDWHRREGNRLKQSGLSRNKIGRLRRLPGAQQWGKEQHEAINAGINFPIQSLAWDICWEAATCASECTADTDCRNLVGTVHDSLLAECEDAENALPATVDCLRFHMLSEAPRRLERLGLHILPGLLDVDFAVGPWGSKTTPEQHYKAMGWAA